MFFTFYFANKALIDVITCIGHILSEIITYLPVLNLPQKRKSTLLTFIFKSVLRIYCALSIQIIFCGLPLRHGSGTKIIFYTSILTTGVKNMVTLVSVKISILSVP